MTTSRPRATTLLTTVVGMTALLGGCSGTSEGPTITGSTSSTGMSGTNSPSSSGTGGTGGTASSPTSGADAFAQCVTDLAKGLSDEERLGQLFMVGLAPGSTEAADATITKNHVGSVVLLGGWTGSSTVKEASAHAQSLAGDVELLVAADQEGGQVQQLKGAGFSVIPTAAEQSAMSPEKLTAASTTWAKELTAAGVNVNLAPVADTVPASIGTANGPIGQFHREYGDTTLAVIPPVEAFIEGMHDGGVAATVKHFPGLGRITNNTDTSATGITDNIATTSDPYLEPFATAIRNGTDLVMVGSARYPKLDKANQAMFSTAIVTDLLRKKLQWDGVVITDDVGAAVSVAAIPVGERATRFLDAGGDIVLTAKPQDVQPMLTAIRAEMDADPAFADKVDAAVTRVLTLKSVRGLTPCVHD